MNESVRLLKAGSFHAQAPKNELVALGVVVDTRNTCASRGIDST
jgi:hypothetical protein